MKNIALFFEILAQYQKLKFRLKSEFEILKMTLRIEYNKSFEK